MVAPAQAQEFVAIHSFQGSEGLGPMAGLTMDRAGNLYGTASGGGNTNSNCPDYGGCGTVFKLTLRNSHWVLTPLYLFSGPDGANPASRVIFGPDGSLYGTTLSGGSANQGSVFRLSPPPTICKAVLCPWRETVLHSFQGGTDGAQPQYGDLVFDQQGNLYGTTPQGGGADNCSGFDGCGVVYKLTPSNGGWTESVLYRFQGANDGGGPYAGMIFDSAGNLYGVASFGGTYYCGAFFELSPTEGGWTESVLYNFDSQTTGQFPLGGLLADQAGNLYGASSESGEYGTGGGTVYELTPANGSWTATVLYGFDAYTGSLASLAMDPAGNLYGTVYFGDQEVFRITPSSGEWTLTGYSGSLGGYPSGNVILDAAGNVYSTAFSGGAYGKGVVFEITP
jgi:uncharacterized repeat protein (TIGR03803 family)